MMFCMQFKWTDTVESQIYINKLLNNERVKKKNNKIDVSFINIVIWLSFRFFFFHKKKKDFSYTYKHW